MPPKPGRGRGKIASDSSTQGTTPIPLIGKDGDDVIDNLPVNSRVQSQ